jgi:hypothetical protein
MSRKFSEKNEQVAETVTRRRARLMQVVADWGSVVVQRKGEASSFTPLLCHARHLSAEPDASDEAWSVGVAVR